MSLSKLFKSLDPVSGRRRGRPSHFKVSQVLNNSLSIFGNTLEDKAIRIHIEQSFEGDATGYGYKEDLQASLMNILENAIHWLGSSSQEERWISVIISKKEKTLCIAIENNGPTIDEAYADSIFEAGFSLKSDGTGLGLAIAREACRASKGEIKFYQENENTTSKKYLPLGEEA